MQTSAPRPITTDRAPAAISAYSLGIDAGPLVVVSGQIGLGPDGGEIPTDIHDETRAVMENIAAVLDAAGLTMASVIKTTIFVTDFDDYGAVNEVYAEYFETPPARSTVKVAGLLKGARVEIEALAVRTGSGAT
jgi:2-iminobutanoate/2-iminopropanoate deaminase